MPDLETIRAILDSGDFSRFLGLEEDRRFDAKDIDPYHGFSGPNDVLELTKDVTSFANGVGGYIVIGLNTEQVDNKNTEKVSEVRLFENTTFDAAKVLAIVATNSYPRILGLEAKWVASKDDATKGLAFIHIPPQKIDDQPFLNIKVMSEGVKLTEIVFGITQRFDDHSDSLKVEKLHDTLRRGKDDILQRLSRIEKRVDEVAENLDRIPPKDSGLQSRIENILDS